MRYLQSFHGHGSLTMILGISLLLWSCPLASESAGTGFSFPDQPQNNRPLPETGQGENASSEEDTSTQGTIEKKLLLISNEKATTDGNNKDSVVQTAIDNSDDELSINAFYRAKNATEEKPETHVVMEVKIKENGLILGKDEEQTPPPSQGTSQPLALETVDGQPVGVRSPAAPAPQEPMRPTLTPNQFTSLPYDEKEEEEEEQPALNSGAGFINDGFHGSLAPGFEKTEDAVKEKKKIITGNKEEVRFLKQFKKYDRDDNYIVSLREFSVYQLRIFKRYDSNDDGQISLGEVKRYFARNPKAGLNLLKKLDRNRDRIIDRDEFRIEIIARFRQYDLNRNGIVELGG